MKFVLKYPKGAWLLFCYLWRVKISLRGLQQLYQLIIFMHRQEDSLKGFIVWMHIWSRLHDPPQLYSLAHISKGLMEHTIEVMCLRLEVEVPQ